MKKLISIGVALALLTMVVVPGAVAAQDPITPDSYAKIPFAIIGSGLELMADIWLIVDTPAPGLAIGMPWIATVLDVVAPWTAGPLGWTVDMLSWSVGLAADVLDGLFKISLIANALPPGVGAALVEICDTIACGLLQPWSGNVSGSDFLPCGTPE